VLVVTPAPSKFATEVCSVLLELNSLFRLVFFTLLLRRLKEEERKGGIEVEEEGNESAFEGVNNCSGRLRGSWGYTDDAVDAAS
jgi:hypothetical protein